MSGITSAGIGSGLNLESVIKAEVAQLYSYQYTQLNEKETENELDISAWGTLRSSMGKFSDAVEKLSNANDLAKKTLSIDGVDSSKSSYVDLVSTNDVGEGSFTLEVLSLAESNQLQSSAFSSSSDTVGSGDLTFTVGSDSFTVSVEATDTLEDIRDKINNASENSSINANVINTGSGAVLVYDNMKQGAANALTVTGSDASLDNITTAGMTETRTASNAQIILNGMTIENDTNRFADTIDGLTFDVTAKTTAAVELAVKKDTDSTKELINEFISSYNALINEISRLSDPDLSDEPTSDGKGALAFEPAVRSLKFELVETVTGFMSDNPLGMQSLYDLGIELEDMQRNGSLLLEDSSRLDKALASNFDDLENLFSGTNGIAKKLTNLMDTYLDSNGVITATEKSLNEKKMGFVDERISLDEGMAQYEASLRQKYAALDSIIAGYNSQLSYIKSLNFGNSSDDDKR